MKILIRKSDNIVLYAGHTLTLSKKGLQIRSNMIAADINKNDHEIKIVANIPDDFSGGAYTYSGGRFQIENEDNAACPQKVTAVQLYLGIESLSKTDEFNEWLTYQNAETKIRFNRNKDFLLKTSLIKSMAQGLDISARKLFKRAGREDEI